MVARRIPSPECPISRGRLTPLLQFPSLKVSGNSAMVSPVNDSSASDELTICRLGDARKAAEPCSILIFGASGDLTARKLIPAFYHLYKDKQMPPAFRIIGFARREKSAESFRQELRQALDQFSRTKPVDDKVWAEFSANIFYCQGEFSD